MHIKDFLTPAVRQFILKNEEADLHQLALKVHLFPDLSMPLIISQITARQKAKVKLPSFYTCENIIYPTMLSLEQCSSEKSATYKANLLKGNLLIDLTGGFGVDTYFLSKHFRKVIYVEKNTALTKIAKHNFQVLKADNVEVINSDSVHFLTDFEGRADCIYLDPARRDIANRKVVKLDDCEPNVLEIMPLLAEKVKQIVLKTSPMLDIDLAVGELNKTVSKEVNIKILVLAVENECKEVVYLIQNESKQVGNFLSYQTINFSKNQVQQFDFDRFTEHNADINYTLPQAYLYEPNVAILKAGGFKSVALRYNLTKLHANSHLYTSTNLVTNFAGRVFRIQAITKLDKKGLKQYLPESKANIAVRNFPLSVAEIRKKMNIKEGGDIYLFATTDCESKKIVLVCTKI